jgi:hypothetical protein
MKKENKSITVSKNKITVNYHDTSKHFTYVIPKDSPTREMNLFGKQFKGTKASEIKKDFLTPEQRELFNDLVYAKHKMTKFEINNLPLIKKYRVKVLSKEVEKALTKWKNEIVYSKIDSLLLKLFPKSPVVKQFVNVGYEDVEDLYHNNISIHSLASEEQIAQYLSNKGLFPKIN